MKNLQNRTIVVVFTLLVALVLGCTAAVTAASVDSTSPLANSGVAKSETALGDLVADAVRVTAQADIAFVAASEIKQTDTAIPAGKVSSDSIAGLISYTDDPLVVLKLTGSDIISALEKSISIYPQPNMGFLQVSGLKYSFKPSKKAGSRVTSVIVGKAAIDPGQSYTVAVTSSMANGALGYWKIWSKDNIQKKLPDSSIISAVTDYFTANKKIDYGKLNRIEVLE